MKKLLTFLLVLLMLLAMPIIPVGANDSTSPQENAKTKLKTFTQEEIDAYAAKDGTVTVGGIKYYVICTPQQLINISNTSSSTDKYYILAQDIDLSQTTLTPVKKHKTSVFGKGADCNDLIIEGNGCTLNNVDLNFDIAGAGLFPTSSYGKTEIYHLTVNATCNFSANYCGVLIGEAHKESKVAIKYVDVNATINSLGEAQGVSAYVGRSGSRYEISFTGCNATGSWNFTSTKHQAGGFVAQTLGKTSFTDCTVNADIVSYGERKAGFVGQHYNTGELTFTNCISSGDLYETGAEDRWLSGYVGAVYYENTVTFNNCISEVKIAGRSANSGFIGGFDEDIASGTAATGTVTFNGCIFSGSVISLNNASGLVGDGGSVTTVSVNDCKSSGKVVTGMGDVKNGFVGGDNARVTIDKASADSTVITTCKETESDLASGKIAYELCKAQETVGITKYRYGQDLGDEASVPSVNEHRVYKVETARGYSMYSNTNYASKTFETPEDGSASVHYQVKTGETYSFRALIDVSEAYLGEVSSMTLKIEFKTADGKSKVLTVKNADIEKFYAVIAEDEIYETRDGRVLLAASVEGIPTDAWTGDVKITLVTTGSAGARAAYNVSSESNAFSY